MFSLGALHDGEDNQCVSNDRYIMAASGKGIIPPEKRPNQWHFSNCSINYFNNFISGIIRYYFQTIFLYFTVSLSIETGMLDSPTVDII